MSRKDRLGPILFQRVYLNDIPYVEDLLNLNILPCDINTVEGNIIGELARRSVQKHENTVRLLRQNNRIRYVSNNNSAFQ